MICKANQLTGFYMMVTLAFNELTLIYYYPSFGKVFSRLRKLLIIIDVDEDLSSGNPYFTDVIYHLQDKFTNLCLVIGVAREEYKLSCGLSFVFVYYFLIISEQGVK